MKMRNRKYI